MKTIIHVNQHRIKSNRADGGQRPVLTVKNSQQNLYSNTAIIRDLNGEDVGRFVYRPLDPLSCGAVVWFETNSDYVVLENPQTYVESANNIVPFQRETKNESINSISTVATI